MALPASLAARVASVLYMEVTRTSVRKRVVGSRLSWKAVTFSPWLFPHSPGLELEHGQGG